jgi:hypothetical protein
VCSLNTRSVSRPVKGSVRCLSPWSWATSRRSPTSACPILFGTQARPAIKPDGGQCLNDESQGPGLRRDRGRPDSRRATRTPRALHRSALSSESPATSRAGLGFKRAAASGKWAPEGEAGALVAAGAILSGHRDSRSRPRPAYTMRSLVSEPCPAVDHEPETHPGLVSTAWAPSHDCDR